MKLRRDDYFSELMAPYNRILSKLKEKQPKA